MGCQSSQMMAEAQPFPVTQQPISAIQLAILISSSNFEELQRIADGFFKDGKIMEAIHIYQKMIEEDYSVDFDIAGLGNHEHSDYRYEWFIYRWYDGQRTAGKVKGNAFDALSLCFNIIRNSNREEADRGILWYEDMMGLYESVELLVGYANILYNRDRCDEAIKAYNKAIEKRPSLINAYVGIAMIYELRRVQKTKSIAIANKVLTMDPENMYAHFILARNEKDIDEKIVKLKVVAQKFPEYVRVTTEIGIYYGGTKKMHRESILWHAKCMQITPEFANCYNNIGVNHELLKEYETAMDWYFKACQYNHEYQGAHINVTDIFDTLKFTDADIFAAMKKYPKLDPFMFYYHLGLAYYGKKQNDKSLKWYKKAEGMKDKSFKLMNAMGCTYDEIKDFPNGEKYYLKSIQLNPKYFSAYYNLAILYNNQSRVDDAITWYKKAIEANPRYSYAYYNLGNIYQNRKEYSKAIECFRNAVEDLSNLTIAYANMAICLLKLEKYQDAFNTFKRAKELLPTDNNNLSEGNRTFLKESLERFDKEGEKWRKTGSIDTQEKETLKSLIKSFESNFNRLYTGEASLSVSDARALKSEVLQIVNMVYQDKFALLNIDRVFELVKHIFHDDEEYFHIIPQLFIQHFWNSNLIQKQPILDIEARLQAIIKAISKRESPDSSQGQAYSLNITMKNFNPPNSFKVNLFKDMTFFNSYEALYSEIDKVNKQAEESLPEFKEFVEAVRMRSSGIPYGVNMKLPKDTAQQFKVILRILEKMFKKEINEQRVKSIISKIDAELRKKGNTVTLLNVVHEIMEVWTKEITEILAERGKQQIETTCEISDFLRGKIMFDTIDDLGKAVDACDKLCHLRGYEILQLDNRLSKPQTTDVVLKIKVKEAVCEFQLAMRQDESKYHLIHSIYEIERSPLGCIFGSYLFMSKGFTYPLLANCKDIEARLTKRASPADKGTVEAAQYIINALESKK